jgi:hypothetical protein
MFDRYYIPEDVKTVRFAAAATDVGVLLFRGMYLQLVFTTRAAEPAGASPPAAATDVGFNRTSNNDYPAFPEVRRGRRVCLLRR